MENFFGYHWTLQWYDYLRLLTAALAIGAFYISIDRARDNWDNYTQRLRELLYVFNGLLFIVFEAQLEQVLTNASFGPRVVLSFIVSLAAVRAVHRKQGYLIHEINES